MFTKEQYLFLLEQFLMEPSERTPEYGRRLVNTFVTSMVVSGRELVINFNVSDETVNKNKKTSQTNLQKKVRLGCVWSSGENRTHGLLNPIQARYQNCATPGYLLWLIAHSSISIPAIGRFVKRFLFFLDFSGFFAHCPEALDGASISFR